MLEGPSGSAGATLQWLVERWNARDLTSEAVADAFAEPYMGLGAEMLAAYLQETGDRIGSKVEVTPLEVDERAVRAFAVGDRGAAAVQVVVDMAGRATAAVGVPCGRSPVELQGHSPTSDRGHEWFDDLIATASAELDLVSMSAALIEDGGVAHVCCVGSVGEAAATSPTSSFGWGSVTKLFTALGVLVLAAGGEVDLDRPANDYLRAFHLRPPEGAPPISVRHLLTHRTGGLRIGSLPIYSFGPGPHPEQRLAYAPVLEADGPAGRAFAYDNLGFAALGQIIEDISGEPFDSWLAHEVLTPLGCRSVTFAPYAGTPDEGRFVRIGHLTWQIEPYAIVPLPAGGLRCSTSDMASALAMLSTRGAGSLPTDAVDALFTAQPTDAAFGLGSFLATIRGATVGFHTGGGPGIASVVAVAAGRGAAVAIVTNTDDTHLPRPAHARFQHVAGQALHRLLE